jgi:hypothetical protein
LIIAESRVVPVGVEEAFHRVLLADLSEALTTWLR